MANIDFDQLRQKAINAAENIADKSAEIYKKAEAKTRILTRKAKLTADISRDKNALRRIYTEIGKQYYELFKDAPDEAFKEKFAEAAELHDSIKAANAEIEELKQSGYVDDDDDIEVEIIIDRSNDESETPEEADAPAEENKTEE